MDSEVYKAGLKLFLTDAVTISKSGNEVKVSCDDGDDAKKIFDFLCYLGGIAEQSHVSET